MATITNANLINFETYEGGGTAPDARSWKLFDSETGGVELWSADFAVDPALLTSDRFYQIEIGALPLQVPKGNHGASDAMARKAVLGMVSESVWIQLYNVSGNPDSDRVEIASSDWNAPTDP